MEATKSLKNYFEVSVKSHSTEKCKSDPLGFLNIHYVAKYHKIAGGPFGDIWRNFENKSHSAEQNWKGGPCSLWKRYIRTLKHRNCETSELWNNLFELTSGLTSAKLNKWTKSGPIALNWRQNLAAARVLYFLRKRRLKMFIWFRQHLIIFAVLCVFTVLQTDTRHKMSFSSGRTSLLSQKTNKFLCPSMKSLSCLLWTVDAIIQPVSNCQPNRKNSPSTQPVPPWEMMREKSRWKSCSDQNKIHFTTVIALWWWVWENDWIII